jgi:HYR domain
MVLRPVRRALTLAIVAVLAVAGTAAADNLRADGDTVTPGAQTFVDLGEVGPSAIVTVAVGFELACTSTTHPDPGQSITLTWAAQAAPSGGAVVSATSATLGPVPAGWTTDGVSCPSPSPVLAGTTTSTVTLRAPAVPNSGYVYTIGWSRSVSPAGIDDAHALSGSFTSVAFTLAVVTNTAPVLTVPGDLTVEGDTTGGWTAAYPGVSASDAEDDPDPTPICSPAAGEVLPLGTTTVACTVTDSGGRTDSDTFDVTVVDTTAPALTTDTDHGVTTNDPSGAVLAYDPASATDIVDPAPVVGCLPAAGTSIPVGTTTVTCTATDASGNSSTGSFDVTVDYVGVHVATAVWMEPVGGGADNFVANRGRTIPVKVALVVDGVNATSGNAHLTVTPCLDGSGVVQELTFGGGRWNASLDTSQLAGSCHVVSAFIDDLNAGSFRLELRGGEPASGRAPKSK